MKNTIQPETLKFHRQRARLSQDALAQKSRVGKKTISRIENGKGNNIRANTANRLAAALQIKPEDLAMPPQEGSHFGATNRKFRTYIDTNVALAFAIVEHRYNVSYQSLVEMAPLFFTLLAEGSLAWRKEQLSQIEKAADIAMEWGRTGGHPAYCVGSAEIKEFGILEEEDSIDNIDLFGEKFGGRADELDYVPWRKNPFSEYLKKLVADVSENNILELDSPDSDEFFYRAEGKMPAYTICKSEIESITEGKAQAKHALAYGYVKISDIPDELKRDDAKDERIEWIMEKIPDDERRKLEEQERLWADLFTN